MYELRIYPYACNGESCYNCERLLPGFVTIYSGKLKISDYFQKKKNELIDEMLQACPTSALSFDKI